MKFCIGDKVKITDTSGIYPNYLAYLQQNSHSISDEVLSKFSYSHIPEDDEKDDEYVIGFIGHHLTLSCFLCVITNSKHTFIVDENCLELIGAKEEAELKEGDRVKVIDYGKCYTTYENFMLKHKKSIDSNVFWKYRYNHSYDDFYNEEKDYGFTVRFVANHIERPDEGKLAIISNDRDTFLFHVDGLQKI